MSTVRDGAAVLVETFSPTPSSNPLALFAGWYEEAQRNPGIKYAAATCLSTIDDDGSPDARIVLLMSFDDRGFVVFTDAESRKARSLARDPRAALTFYWGPLDRQVRVRGVVEKASDEIADVCFAERPRGSKLTAWASRQSRPLVEPGDLERRYAEVERRFAGREDVPRPAHWQAYRLVPERIEFWEARANRLHERRIFTRGDGGAWVESLLDP